jgi:AraC-like DNA-binding protein
VVENLMRWMPGVGFGIMIFMLSAPITCLCPRWIGINQLALGIIMMIYTFVCVINFSLNYNKVAVAITPGELGGNDANLPENPDNEDTMSSSTSLNDSLRDILHEKAQRWIERGGYRTPGITIEHVARDMGTNRSYLSRYLNELRHVNFYEWVAQLRIEEAQSLMRTHPSMLIEQIASRVGFTSASTFSSTFKKIVGITPNKWRNQL